MTKKSYKTSSDFLSWGRIIRRPQRVSKPYFRDELAQLINTGKLGHLLAVGMRRSYGDSCLNSHGYTIDMTNLDRIISFDDATGVLRAEAGASLSDILTFCVPRGWFLPTTPGTRFVSLGGAIANDVHGKNHHKAGSFGCHVRSFSLTGSDGYSRVVTVKNEPELFSATIGGLGLTGIVDWVEIQLVKIFSSYLDVEVIPYAGLDEFWTIAQQSNEAYEHTVSWIDCTSFSTKFGRGIFSRANWSNDQIFTTHNDKTWKNIPFEAPSFLLNKYSISAFNQLYFHLNKSKSKFTRQHYSSFFYPLDSLSNWNRLYGRQGMFQYQCVIPSENARYVIESLLNEITRSGQGSFLAVLKTFGERQSPGLLSFARAGATLALDFPNRGYETLWLLSRLDDIVEEARGSLYPAKDARISAQMFRKSFPRFNEFLKYKDSCMNSDFWIRVSE